MRRKRIGNAVLAALFLLAAAGGASRAAPDTAAVMAEVAAALASGDPATVDRLATAALAGEGLSRPQQAQLLLDRGLARDQQGTRDDALVDLTQGLEMHALAPLEQARGLFDRGVVLEEEGRQTDALDDYGGSLKLVPKFAPALNNRANLWRRQGHAAEARRDYLAALAAVNLHPEFSYFGLGQLAEADGDKAAARAFYAKAVAFDPSYDEAEARLAALDTADDAPVTLRPPPALALAASGQDVVLRPPDVVHLHPPRPHPETAALAPSDLTPAAYHRDPVLRPAMDAVAAPGGPEIQLGAWRSPGEAEAGWSRAQGRAPELLGGLGHRVVPVDLPGRGRYYRLRVGVPGAGAGLCARLEAKGVECMAARD